ncbi:Crp/Fnr family transcriptional regulator [Lichenihabitans sp. Uapishka_5]|uniref:Crp/Fnr family transcriptional regulator n=1 Tax=Lichenihabitans sp. Uapishka_5 TaxID=3037302 RepID=UPI0029E80FFD|nr:Crp/Fnr family transcriptional regulator [Lichenihabitans sp. Uapishka_5]MDX7953304.1 Crp/Fnr family transcriptional regulator [Lichenihabitans sp. Uapishka_5]
MANPLVQKLQHRDTLSAEEQAALEALSLDTRSFRVGETMVRQDEVQDRSTLLLEGFAARVRSTRSGKRQIVAVHLTGDFVDLHSFVLKRIDHSIEALTPCRIASVPHTALTAITERFPHLTRLLWLSTVIDGAVHRAWLAAMGSRSAAGHLAHFICEMFLRLQAVAQTEGQTMRLPFTQTEIGEILGLSSVHVNRTLQNLRAESLLRWQDGVITILDWAGLQRAAEFDPVYLSLQKEPR